MPGFTIIGLGLNSESDLSLRGLEAARRAEEVYLEDYTNLMPDLSIRRLEQLVERPVRLLSRNDLEHPALKGFLQRISSKKVALLVPGDPFTATTHQAVRLEAKKHGLNVNVIHGASIYTAAPGLAGLFIYKFGPSATITFPDNPSDVPYRLLAENRERGLHTFFFLDIKKTEGRYLAIRAALQQLREIEKREGRGIITDESPFVGVARAGSESPVVRWGTLATLITSDFGPPPHALIAPGILHFLEEESLRNLSINA